MAIDSITKISDLDGEYRVVYQAKAPDISGFIWFDHTNATVKIVNGALVGSDDGGTEWVGSLDLNSDQTLAFDVSVDPMNAPETTFVLNQIGQPTREKQRYNGTLKLLPINEEITIYGTVVHGVVSIEIKLQRT